MCEEVPKPVTECDIRIFSKLVKTWKIVLCAPSVRRAKKTTLYCAIYDATTSAAANTLHNPKSFGASADEERCDRDHSNVWIHFLLS